jgi:hypothetical protein
MTQIVEPHVRYCYGCGQHDDAPRVHDIEDAMDPASKIYHYQCVPAHIVDEGKLHPEVVEHVDAGLKDDELRAAVVASQEG